MWIAAGGAENCVLGQAAVTLSHGLGGLNKEHIFLPVLETEKSRITMPVNSAAGESSLPGLQVDVLLCRHVVGRDRMLCVASFHKETDLPMGPHPLHLI